MALNPLVITASGGLKELPLVTTIGATGSDSAIPTEQAVREALDTLDNAIPAGTIWETARRTAPAGWLLLEDGAAVSRATYATLFDAIVPSLGTFTVTIASPAVVSLPAHGFIAGDSFYVTTTGALPTGMAANTLYYVTATELTTDSFQFSATLGGAEVNTSGSQSGTHILRACPYGLGDGSTTFNLPKHAGRVGVGQGAASGLTTRNLGAIGGEEGHALTANENGAHTHLISSCYHHDPTQNRQMLLSGTLHNYNDTGAKYTGQSGSGTPHNTMQPYIIVNYMIKT